MILQPLVLSLKNHLTQFQSQFCFSIPFGKPFSLINSFSHSLRACSKLIIVASLKNILLFLEFMRTITSKYFEPLGRILTNRLPPSPSKYSFSFGFACFTCKALLYLSLVPFYRLCVKFIPQKCWGITGV